MVKTRLNDVFRSASRVVERVVRFSSSRDWACTGMFAMNNVAAQAAPINVRREAIPPVALFYATSHLQAGCPGHPPECRS
jgi:hypothetical protein